MFGQWFRTEAAIFDLRRHGRAARRQIRRTAAADEKMQRQARIAETLPPTRLGRVEMRAGQAAAVSMSAVTVLEAVLRLRELLRTASASQPVNNPPVTDVDGQTPPQ